MSKPSFVINLDTFAPVGKFDSRTVAQKVASAAKFTATVVADEEELCKKFSGSEMVIIYDRIRGDRPRVGKFQDKPTAAKRIMEILMETNFEPEKKEKTPAKKGVKTVLRELFSVEGTSLTMEEIMNATGATKTQIANAIAYLKNEKYCGKDGVFSISRGEDGKYAKG